MNSMCISAVQLTIIRIQKRIFRKGEPATTAKGEKIAGTTTTAKKDEPRNEIKAKNTEKDKDKDKTKDKTKEGRARRRPRPKKRSRARAGARITTRERMMACQRY